MHIHHMLVHACTCVVLCVLLHVISLIAAAAACVELQKEDSMRKIRELGSLPSDAFDKFHGLALSQVYTCTLCIVYVCI